MAGNQKSKQLETITDQNYFALQKEQKKTAWRWLHLTMNKKSKH